MVTGRINGSHVATRAATIKTSADLMVTTAEIVGTSAETKVVTVVAFRAIRALGALIVQGGLAKIPV